MYRILLLFLFSTICLASEPLMPTKVSIPPIIDGKLSNDEWQDVLSISSFKTFSPDFGKDASQKTIAYAAYDSEHLYFAFRCYDNQPDKIKTSVSSRDNNLSDDWVCINLDSFDDQQSLYAFYVNPNGIQADSRFAAGQEDFSADYVWYSAGQILPDGFSIEISIPLKSIRYSDGNPVKMSIFFERYISRLLEHSSYPELDPAKGMAFLIQMKPLVYYDLKNYTLFELLPAFTYSQKFQQAKNDIVKYEDRGDVSLTTKYGITSNLILDGTYNPDFSQVEADAGQVDVNLRYSLYYPEKRPFFLEGSEIFNIAAAGNTIIDPLTSLVHTRTIVNPITGIKLSGKIGARNTLAALYAMDELPPEISETSGDYAHFAVLRYKRSFSDDSYIGGIYTGRELNNSYNRNGGIDGIIRLSNSKTVEYNGIISDTKFNTANESKFGSALNLIFKSDSRDLYYHASLQNIAENFYTETGYLTRNGIFTSTGLLRPRFYPDSSFIKRIDVELFTAQTQDKPSSLWETYNHASALFYIFGSQTARLRYTYSTEVYNGEKFNTGGINFVYNGQLTKDFFISFTISKLQAIYYSILPYQGKSNRISSIIVYKPTENIESYTTLVYSNFYRSSDDQLIYEYPIIREKLTYQFNKYLFFRGITEYNKFRRQLLTDILISFTYVPGTVMHLGYGSIYQRTQWDEFQSRYIDANNFRETQRGFFFKMSYLWRL